MNSNLIEEFAEFLKTKGKEDEATEMLESYYSFKDTLGDTFGDITDEDLDTLKAETKNDMGITIDDCDFMILTILPNFNIHMVNIASEDIADYVASTGSFKVQESPIGKAELNGAFGSPKQKSDNKYLD